jgi:hypothetical protein
MVDTIDRSMDMDRSTMKERGTDEMSARESWISKTKDGFQKPTAF